MIDTNTNPPEVGITTFTALIAAAFQLAQPPGEETAPPNAACALTGAPLSTGYPIAAVVSAAQGEWWETFNGDPYGWLSPSAAACWAATNPKRDMRMSKSFAVFGSTAYEPMVSQRSADAQSRPSWRDLVRHAWQHHHGEPCAISITSDTKKRVWMKGRLGALGSRTPVLIYDMGEIGMHEVITVDWPLMLDDLTLVESLYERGFYRGDVTTTLFRNTKAAERYGWGDTRFAEHSLADARRRPHWPFVQLIARGVDKTGARL